MKKRIHSIFDLKPPYTREGNHEGGIMDDYYKHWTLGTNKEEAVRTLMWLIIVLVGIPLLILLFSHIDFSGGGCPAIGLCE